MEIKKATIDDLFKFQDIVVSGILNQKLPFLIGGTPGITNFYDYCLRDPQTGCFIAVENDKVIGCIAAKASPYAFSDELIVAVSVWHVHKDHRAKGVGGQLLAKVMEWAQYKGLRLVTVGVSAGSSDNPELAFSKLEKAGFKEFERTFYLEV